jgi:hypothetical protein
MVSLLNGSTAAHNDTGVSDISMRMEQHNQRQLELEHYVRVLLGKEPGKPVEDDIAVTKNMVRFGAGTYVPLGHITEHKYRNLENFCGRINFAVASGPQY